MSADPQALKSLWQSLPSQPAAFSHEQMRKRAEEFQAKHKRKDAIEYAAWAVLLVMVVYLLTLQGQWENWVFSGLIVLGGGVTAWNYYRRMGHKRMPSSQSGESLTDFMRRELTRQRDGAASAWRWYMLPLLPSILFIIGVRWLETGATLLELTDDRLALAMFLGFVVSTFIAVIFWQFLSAARYQRQLDALDR